MPSGYQLTPAELAAVQENGSARDKAAAASGQFAQTFSQPLANQGVRAGATQIDLSAAPSKASAAPVAGKAELFTGLCDALNQHQAQLVKDKKREIPDQYEIVFAPAPLGDSTIKRPGDLNIAQAPMQNNATPTKLNTANNSVDHNAMTWPVAAGTQIIQLIDNVLRVSSFVTDQQIVQVSPVADPVTGVQKQVPSPGTGKPLVWFKISVAAVPLGTDHIINDFAYKMTFIISSYQPSHVISQYFPTGKYRGVHKSYQYWFTGNNTQILSYEQKYDNAYRIAMTGIGANIQKTLKTDFRDQNRKIYVANSENHAQGGKDYTNEPGDNAASFLYDPKSLSTVKMRIVGDPAWLQQGECGLGVSAKTFNFNPFLPDGSINFDAQSIMFDVSFNQPVDYDFGTGIMNTNTMNKAGLPQEHYTFTAIECKSTFSKGRFEQELTGKLVTDEIKASSNSDTGRASKAAIAPTGYRDTTNSSISAAAEANPDNWNDGTATQSTGARTEDEFNADNPPTPQPAAPPGNPTSTGDITAADIAAIEANRNVPVAPQTAEQATAAIAAGSGYVPTPLTVEQQQIQRLNSPQIIAKDDS